MDAQFAPNPVALLNGEPVAANATGVPIGDTDELIVTPPPREVFTDQVIISGDVGATTARYFVPTNNNLGTNWTTTSFNDAGWQSGPFGFGYENNPADYQSLIRTRIRPQDVNGSATTFMVRIPFEITDPAELPAQVRTLLGRE